MQMISNLSTYFDQATKCLHRNTILEGENENIKGDLFRLFKFTEVD